MSKSSFFLAAILSVSIATNLAIAAPFGTGNIAVYRVGDGALAITSDPAPVFIDEYSPTGTLIQSIALPTTDNGANQTLSAQGSATLEGLLKQSTNGQYLLLTGYDHTPGIAIPPTIGNGTLAQTSAAEVSRTIGRIDAAGNINTSTTINDSGQGSPRSAISDDGTNLWLSHGSVGTDTTPDGGVRFTTLGTSGPSTFISAAVTDPRAVGIYNGQLYISAQTADSTTTPPSPVAAVGSGTPTASDQTIAGLPGVAAGLGQNVVDFFLADLDAGVAGLDTLYVTGDTAAALTKYSLVSGTWTSNGTIGVNADDYRGLAAVVNGSTVTLYATLSNGNNADTLVSVVDSSGYNAALTGTATLIATAGANTQFKGVAFTPAAAPAGVPGDYNSNGTVDAADYVLWRNGTQPLTNEVVTPGTTEPGDYDAWCARFGNSNPGSAVGTTAPVPEPTVIVLLAISLITVVGRHRARRLLN